MRYWVAAPLLSSDGALLLTEVERHPRCASRGSCSATPPPLRWTQAGLDGYGLGEWRSEIYTPLRLDSDESLRLQQPSDWTEHARGRHCACECIPQQPNRHRRARRAGHRGGADGRSPAEKRDNRDRENLQCGGEALSAVIVRDGGYIENSGVLTVSEWLPHGIGLTGLEPRFITAELTLAHSTPAMSELIPLAHQSLADARAQIDALWVPVGVAS